MGVVYYANYFRFFEAGRNELLRVRGLTYKDFEAEGYQLPVTDARAKYHAPAHYDDELTLTTSVERVRFGSLRMGYRLEREADRQLIATGETTHACIQASGRVCRIPDHLRRLLVESAPVETAG